MITVSEPAAFVARVIPIFEPIRNRLHLLHACHSHLRASAYKIDEVYHARLYPLPLDPHIRIDALNHSSTRCIL